MLFLRYLPLICISGVYLLKIFCKIFSRAFVLFFSINIVFLYKYLLCRFLFYLFKYELRDLYVIYIITYVIAYVNDMFYYM